ncbi:hypothetical protein McanMca71_007138 [Microsporum canis]
MDPGPDPQRLPEGNDENSPQTHSDQHEWDEDHTKSLTEGDATVEMRKRIHAIWKLDISSQEKARLMHDIMTEGYYSAIKSRSTTSTLQGNENPHTPESPKNRRVLGNPSSSPASAAILSGSPYYLSQDDLERTYFCKPADDHQLNEVPFMDPSEDPSVGDTPVELGCIHYKRNVKVQCFTCKKWYPCRFCHNEAELHILDRKKTENMLCMLNLDRTIMSQPMPPELKDTIAVIHCNDCHAKSVVPYHWLGLKCEVCESYNTIQRQLLNGSYDTPRPIEGRQNPITDSSGGLTVPFPGSSNDHRTGARNSVIETPGHHFSESHIDGQGTQARSLPQASFLHDSRAPPRSPVVTNYFELSRREDIDNSTSQIRGPGRLARGSFSGFNFWSGVSIKEKLGLAGSSDAGTEPGSDGSSDNEETEDEDDEDESPDSIDIFGHR